MEWIKNYSSLTKRNHSSFTKAEPLFGNKNGAIHLHALAIYN